MSKILEKLQRAESVSPPQTAPSNAAEKIAAAKPRSSKRRVLILAAMILALGSFGIFRFYKKHFKKQPTPVTETNTLEQQLSRTHADALQAIEQKNYGKAVSHFEELVAKVPDKPEPLINLAYALKKNGDLERAEKALLKALSLQSTSALALNNLGLVYFEKKNFEKAFASLNEALAKDSKYSPSLLNLAYVYEVKKSWADAVAAYERYKISENAKKDLVPLIEDRIRRLHSYAVGGSDVQ